MNKIDAVFSSLQAAGETAFIPFITVGDPKPELTIDILKQVERAGANIVELGVPYSDPLADGPVIQRASLRALKHHITIKDCIQIGKSARDAGIKLPFILFTYYNPVLQFGLEQCFRLMKENDFSGIIIPDLPVEEDEEVRSVAKRYDIHLIPLVAPTSEQRIAKITARASGFIYCVSSLGVTGVRSEFDDRVKPFIQQVKAVTSLPAAIGFGISNHDHVKQFSQFCDAVVVGSAIIRKVEELETMLLQQQTRNQALEAIYLFVRQLKNGA